MTMSTPAGRALRDRAVDHVRVATLDLGTNSTRLLIADVNADGRLEEVDRRSAVTRLGEGVDTQGRLKPAAIDRVCVALDVYAELIRSSGCQAVRAVMTSAVRDAANGPEFVSLVNDRYDVEARTITGDEEARLTFRGAMSEREADPTAATLVIDVGGGSTELIIGAADQISFHVSLQAGVVRQTERHLPADPPTAAQLLALRRDVRALIKRHVPPVQLRRATTAIAVAGTAVSCAAIDQGLREYDSDRVQGYPVELTTCRLLLARVAGVPLAARRTIRGLHPDRAPTIIAGIAILVEVLQSFGLPGFEASEHDILRGAALELSEALAA
ncbi:MAG: exopolyphosphatase / guanosine-5-triphosphate,3-diphosphate pyrophosphatase [Solirubrobacteraceae bacterium]|nr:exopolyphosphatase / guanosine-5-triphosphate,3-diphosphate pyrophosphatase [Solirubrobacteraceae bacterium]